MSYAELITPGVGQFAYCEEMLKHLEVKSAWRTLEPGFWPENIPFGKRTVIYGHNGSGKSTLADLLLGLADGDSPTALIWEDEHATQTGVRPGDAGPSPAMAVFTREWVRRNLDDFLDGESASAIVTLGQAAIDAKQEEERLADELALLRQAEDDAKSQIKATRRKMEQVARDTQDQIDSDLRQFDHRRFTKNAYNITRVERELAQFKGNAPDTGEYVDALLGIGEDAPTLLPMVVDPPALDQALLTELGALLSETPVRKALAELTNNNEAQSWAEQGLRLHREREQCLFCAGPLSAERWLALEAHFDESWKHLRQRAEDIRKEVAATIFRLDNWMSALPDPQALPADLIDACETSLMTVDLQLAKHRSTLEAILAALDEKVRDPSNAPPLPDLGPLAGNISMSVIRAAVDEHNRRSADHETTVEDHLQTALLHIFGSRAPSYAAAKSALAAAEKDAAAKTAAAKLVAQSLSSVRQAQFSSSEMAATLTADLARVYGKHHLQIVVTSDGKSYQCVRADGPATRLSDGERTTLSLLYFLRKLEDETQGSSRDSDRVVVIDDPSSSLDREAVFATHAWMIETLAEIGQFIVLTHDFSLLRLFVKSQKSQWDKSARAVANGETAEQGFPRVAFLEMYATTGADGRRQTRIAALPDLLRKNTSEYAFLFASVMAGVQHGVEYDRLFLLPNAARRVLEFFASYKAPHKTQFGEQLKELVESDPSMPYRDVYDFCNRFSHGEGSEGVDAMDARATHSNISRAMQFLRSVDREHFDRMCVATGVDIGVLD